MELPLLGGVLKPPQFIPDEQVAICHTYREAVRLSWKLKRSQYMTQRTLCELAGLYAPHVTDYLHEDDSQQRRNLPADKLTAWACVVGNYAVQQWLAREANLTYMEEVIARRAA